MKERFLQFKEEWNNIQEQVTKEYVNRYFFAKHAPKGSFEEGLLEELVIAKQTLDQIPKHKFMDRNKAKKVLDNITIRVDEAYQDFISRGKVYKTSKEDIINE